MFYGNQTILPLTAGIVDTGTTLVLIASGTLQLSTLSSRKLTSLFSDAFDAYQTATGATVDQTTGLLTISEDQLDSLDSLYFDIAGVRSLDLYAELVTEHVCRRDLNSPLTPKSGLARSTLRLAARQMAFT